MLALVLLSYVLIAAAIFGLLVVLVEQASLWRHLRERVPRPFQTPGISILKPLCGVDDDLQSNLELFCHLDYPSYELLLGVKSADDAAYPLACAAAKRYPGKVRVVVQRGEPGRNAKINQLVTLEREAKYEILVVSDSNVRVRPDYLQEISAVIQDQTVGLVIHPIVGSGERRLGSLMDRLHLANTVSPGMIAPKRFFGADLVVGKSMAIRKADIRQLGGFERFKDVLAEDYLMGRSISRDLNKQVRFAHQSIVNVSHNVTVGEFFARAVRWAIIQRTIVGRVVYSCQLFLNPVVLALLGLLVHPSLLSLAAFAAVCVGKSLGDGVSRSLQEHSRLRLRDLLLTPFKDLVIGGAFFEALVRNTVVWRGRELTVMRGTRLAPLPRPPKPPEVRRPPALPPPQGRELRSQF